MPIASLRHNLASLLRFSGRSSRAQFWPYAGVLLALTMVALQLAMLPAISRSMARMRSYAVQDPANVTETIGPGSYSIQVRGNHPDLMPDFAAFMPALAAIAAIFILLIAAAAARRLHDSNLRGWWGLLPLPFLTFAMVMMPRVFAEFGSASEPGLDIFFLLFANNVLYLASLAVVALLLIRPGTRGDNRFGPV